MIAIRRSAPWRSLPKPMLALALATLAVAQTFAQNGPPEVVVETVERGPIELRLPLTATVTAPRRASLSPRIAGLVANIEADVGDRVEAGQTLLVLDDDLAELALKEANAAAREAAVERDEQQRLLKEAERLYSNRTIPETQLRARQAQARLAAAVADRLAAARQAQAERLQRHRLTAPFDGVVVERHTDKGEWLDTGAPAYELVATRPVLVDVQVPQVHYPQMNNHVTATVRFDGLDDPVPARIQTWVPVKDPATRTFLVRFTLTDDVAAVTPGMSGRAIVNLSTGDRGLKVPRDAVLRNVDGRTFVWIVEQDGEPHTARRPVRLGRALGEYLEVKSGLEAGDRVVVIGNERLQPGQTVVVLSDEKS